MQCNLKIAVVGPGAVGCLLSHGLVSAGCSVTLIDYREDRARRLASSGITILTDHGEEKSQPACVAHAESAGTQDVVIFTVKAYQTRDAAAMAAPLAGRDTLVVTLQNGMGYEKYLDKITSPGHLITGVTALGATLIQEGVVRLAGRGRTVMGFADVPGEKAEHTLDILGNAFARAGWEFRRVHDPESARWKKLMVNIGINALTAIACMRNGEILKYSDSRRLQESAVREAFAVMQSKYGLPASEYDAIIDNVRDVCRRTSENFSSMLQDRMKKGMTEIDYINGFVCRAGSEGGIDTPVNETLCRLVNLLYATGWRSTAD